MGGFIHSILVIVIFSNGIEVLRKSLSDIKGVDESYFNNWKFSLMNLVEEKVSMYSTQVKAREVRSVLKDCNAKAELNKLHQDFIIVPIDKASSNVAFICKRHYAEVILDELKFSTKKRNAQNLDTYENAETPLNDILRSHSYMLKKHNLSLEEDHNFLPCMYWMPKLHKVPIGNRFIIASSKCSLKPLLKDTTIILKLFQNQIKNFHDKKQNLD